MLNIQTPIARNHDPESSHIAAKAITNSDVRRTNMEKVLAALSHRKDATAAELVEETGLDAVEIRRRLYDLNGVHAQQGEQRKCRVSNKKVLTWARKK